MNVLIIDNDEKLVNALKYELKEAQCEVQCAADGEAGLMIALTKPFDLILMDWTLPNKSGLSVLKELREQKNMTPILMLTAKDSVGEVVVSLDSGADACVTKPYEIKVLIARMNALVRRKKWNRGAEICFGHIRLDPIAHKVWSDDEEIELSAKEYGLLLYFMQNPEQVVTRTMIAENVWDNTLNLFNNSIDVYVNSLRKKIDYGMGKNQIHTVRMTGYVFKSL